jgi:CheY-like chemotaxis protein
MNDTRILIVEDNPDDESLTQRGLRKSAVEVTVARDGALALEMLGVMRAPANCASWCLHRPANRQTSPAVMDWAATVT